MSFTHAPSEFCSPLEAAAFVGFSSDTLERWRREGKGPKFYKHGGRIRYTFRDLQAFLDEGHQTPSAEGSPNDPNPAQGSDGNLRPRAPSGGSAD